MGDGARLSFFELAETARQFVVLMVRLRSLADVRANGPHPATWRRQTPTAPTPPQPSPAQINNVQNVRIPGPGVFEGAVLECVHSVGCEVRALKAEARRI